MFHSILVITSLAAIANGNMGLFLVTWYRNNCFVSQIKNLKTNSNRNNFSGDPILLLQRNILVNDIAQYKLDERIVGGRNTSIKVLPYQVSVRLQNRHYCGGSIISSNWVVTAAHCTTRPSYLYTVRVGSNKTDEGGWLVRVSRIISHENYATGLKNDIALLRLELPIIFDENSQPILLFEDFELSQTGGLAVVSGWGDLGNGTSPKVLQSVVVPIVSKDECSKAYETLEEGQICAGNLSVGGKDSCQGDSGGPLAIYGRLAGIVSWGRGCAEPNYPGVYTEVSYYRQWIRKN